MSGYPKSAVIIRRNSQMPIIVLVVDATQLGLLADVGSGVTVVDYNDFLRHPIELVHTLNAEVLFLPVDVVRAHVNICHSVGDSVPVVLYGSCAESILDRIAESQVAVLYPAPLGGELLPILAQWALIQRLGVDASRKKSPLFIQNFISASPVMAEVVDQVTKLSPFATTVVITGESGTGKEMIARLIHLNSPRREGAFVAVNCGAIPEGLVESEFFGHRKGSFTDAVRDRLGYFEQASNGTLFLDEVAELPLHVQAKLLRSLQEGTVRRVGDDSDIAVNVRIIAATHRDLEEQVAAGKFREDLYYRLQVVSIHIPPLRERKQDIPVLARYFLSKHRRRLRIKVNGIAPDAMELLVAYPWWGNVRELENTIERGIVMSDSQVISAGDLPLHIRQVEREGPPPTAFISEDAVSIKQVTKEIEITLIRRALNRTSGNRTHAAKLLEISHRSLLYKIKEYGLE